TGAKFPVNGINLEGGGGSAPSCTGSCWPNRSVTNININGTSYPIVSITDSTHLTVTGSPSPGTYYVSSKWDGNTDRTGYPCIAQPGRGKGDLLAGTFVAGTRIDSTTSTVTWPHQAVDPVYVWGNTNTWPGDNQDAVVGVGTTNFVANRDFYQSMA